MPRMSHFDPLLLGGLSPARFLARHWQRTPLLVRGAIKTPLGLPARDDLFELAARDDVESRLIASKGDAWSLEHGPFERLPRARRDWTLLVQGVNLIDAASDALMRRFDFVSSMRLDDVMFSYAADGGGVGPHLDSYDVFLIQVEGRRRWRWNTRPSTTARQAAFVEGLPVKILRHFEPTDEAVLEAGDLLYLPPSCAHEGTAVGPCITASVGFRAPTWTELTQEFLLAMAERPGPVDRYEDAGREPTARPAAIDARWLDELARRIVATRFRAADVTEFVGRHFTEPKAHVYFDPPAPLSSARFVQEVARHGLRVDPRATMLYRGRRVFIAGEAFDLPAATARGLARFADGRAVDPERAALLAADPRTGQLLHEWWQHGWIAFGESDDLRND